MTESDEKVEPQKKRGLLEEYTERREGYSEDAEENPYWLAEEGDPHPNPSLGCIRRTLCCLSNPGWFGPGEAEQAAELLGMAPDAFVREYLIIDYVEVDGQKVEVFAPVKIGRDGNPLIPTATRADRLYSLLRSRCVLLKEGGCSIYGARPVECRTYVCTNAPEDNLSKVQIGRLWLEAAQSGAGEDEEA